MSEFKKLDPPVVVAYGLGIPSENPRGVPLPPPPTGEAFKDFQKLCESPDKPLTLYGVLMELRGNFRKVMAELSEKYKGGISEEDANYAFERVLNDFLMKNAFGDRVLP